MKKINILTKWDVIFFYIEKHDLWAMFTVKHRLSYKSDVKGDNKGWLHKYFQTPDTIYLNKKGSQDSQLNKMR
jgi:hypothetical protein